MLAARRHVDSSSELGPVQWRKSTRSGAASSSCVEVATVRSAIAVRDSKDPEGPALLFDRAAWRNFARGVKAGELENV
jgi:hypothetical protein